MPATHIFRSRPAEQGKFYFDDKTVPNIYFLFRGFTSDGEKWVGQLCFKCRNVPRLMREDIRWTAENIVREDGFFSTIREAEIKEPAFKLDDLIANGFTTTRHFFLCDLPENHPQWIAHFQVHAAKTKVLADFRLEKLSREDMTAAVAFGNPDELKGYIIYNYRKDKPEESFNAIYDYMPLEGWWPWPRLGQK